MYASDLLRKCARRRTSGLLIALTTLLASAACGPVLQQTSLSQWVVEIEREKQREIAFATLMGRQDRLLKVSDPLLGAAAALCRDNVRPNYGFLVHDRRLYEGEYEPAAVRYFGLTDKVSVRHVHPRFPAAVAGLRAGDKVLTVNDRNVTDRRAADVQKMLREAGSPLRMRIERDGRVKDLTIAGVAACDMQVQFLTDDAVNAFADGRNVGITTGMMRFAETDTELALVVAHEIAHNALGHIPKKVGNVLLGTLFDIAAAVLGVDTQGLFGELGARAFSQAFEAEADYAGLYITARAGYDVTQAANFWRRMAAEHPGSIKANFLATHPSSPERFVALENAAEEIVGKTRRGVALLPEGWSRVSGSDGTDPPGLQALTREPASERAIAVAQVLQAEDQPCGAVVAVHDLSGETGAYEVKCRQEDDDEVSYVVNLANRTATLILGTRETEQQRGQGIGERQTPQRPRYGPEIVSAAGGRRVIGWWEADAPDSYIRKVQDDLARRWADQPRLGQVPRGAVVAIQILRDGSIKSVHVQRSSGSNFYDDTAVAAIRDASPFLPLPAEWDNATLRATLDFGFQ